MQAVKEFPIPANPKEIKTYLGLPGYYRKCIPDFAKMTKPMTQCLNNGNKININDAKHVQSFQYSKNLLINEPILQYPDLAKQFIVTTYASNFALCAILSQNIDGKDMLIAYSSCTLN